MILHSHSHCAFETSLQRAQEEAERRGRRRGKNNEAKSSGFCILNGFIYMYNIFKDDDDDADDKDDESVVSLMMIDSIFISIFGRRTR